MNFNPREFGIHLMTVVLLFCTPFYVIPNLSTDLSNYHKETRVLSNTIILEREYTGKFFQRRVERTFLMEMTDGSQWRVSNDYKRYWKEIQNPKNLNKKITMFISNNTSGNSPVQLEIENKVIYDVKAALTPKYILVILTIGMTIYSGTKLNRHLKNNIRPN